MLSDLFARRRSFTPGGCDDLRGFVAGASRAALVMVLVAGLGALATAWTFGLGPVAQPAAGVAVVALALGGRALWPAVLAGAAIGAWVGGLSFAGIAISGAGLTAAAWVARCALGRSDFDPGLHRLSDVADLGVRGILPGAAVFAVSETVVAAIGGAPAGLWPVAALSAAMAFGVGLLTVGALGFTWRSPSPEPLDAGGRCRMATMVALVTALACAIFLQPAAFLRTWHLYPLLVWAALAFNARGASLALSILGLAALMGAHQSLGPNDTESRTVQLLLAQHMILVTSATTLVLAAAAQERHQARELQAARLSAEVELTERRRAQAHQRLLINELNHRVKNTLASVQSMIVQTLRGARDCASASRALTDRLVALSAAHDILTRERWEGADVADIVRAAVAPFEEADATRFEIQGPATRLAPGAALALAMALHELATNAAKYGALTTADGRVTVHWRVQGAEGARRLTLEWHERGGPHVSPPSRRGFGSRLLERGLPAQLHGAVDLDFASTGLRCRLTADLSAHDPVPAIAA